MSEPTNGVSEDSPSFWNQTGPRLVLFDLDDTLFAHRGAMDAGILEYAHALGGPYAGGDPDAEIAYWTELEERHYHSYLAGDLDYEGQRIARARDFAARHGVALDDASASAWYTEFFTHYIGNWRLQEGALPCLDRLAARGIRLGLITNGDLDYQLRKIERVGLTPRFEHVVASGAFGIPKPDARIFHHACALFGIAPTNAAYVGDRLATDAIGAAGAGLTGVWLDRTDAPPRSTAADSAAAAGVIRITSLDALPAAFTAHRSRAQEPRAETRPPNHSN
ncbi:MAG: HAD family hydrolase [Microbacteriaceae bacterium]|nr:MAG: HAD family hydrolase [Microbacteriaceae bacterium]